MSTTKNTIFDISSPDVAVQKTVFDQLVGLDFLQANPIRTKDHVYTMNSFLHYGQGHHSVLNAASQVLSSTNPIHISCGLFADFFVEMENSELKHKPNSAAEAVRALKREVLSLIRIVHIHIKSDCIHNLTRRMALNIWHQSIDYRNPNERWLTFETLDIDLISKQILQYIRESEVPA